MIAVAALPAITESGLPIRFSPRTVFEKSEALFCLLSESLSFTFLRSSESSHFNFPHFSGLYALAIRSGGTSVSVSYSLRSTCPPKTDKKSL